MFFPLTRIDWILLSKDKKESKLKIAQQIAKKSIDVYPNCAELWNRRINISTNIDDDHVIISYEEEDFSTEKLYEISIQFLLCHGILILIGFMTHGKIKNK